MTTKRKPCVQLMTFTWRKKLSLYRFYMLREGTAAPAVWSSIELVFGLFALKNGPGAWAGFVGFLRDLVIVIISLITLAAILLHTKTWFEPTPKAANITVKSEKVEPESIIKSLWAVIAVATIVILFIALYW